MKILKIWAENMRSISAEVSIEFAPDGLTLVSAPNEFGKSTLAQVPAFLIERAHNSKTQELKNLQPVGNPSAPVKMGMRFSINDQIFEIRKSFIKDIGAVLTPIDPIGKEFKGDLAQQKLDSLLEQVDKTFFKILNMPQGQSAKILATSQEDLDGNTSLQSFIENSASLDSDSTTSRVLESAEKEYLGWWTASGKPSNGTGSNGRRLGDAHARASALERDLNNLRGDLTRREDEIKSQEAKISGSGDLGEIYRVQQRSAELKRLHKLLDEFETLAGSRRLNEHLDTKLQSWSQPKHDELKRTRDSFLRIQAMSKIKLTALKEFDLVQADHNQTLKSGEAVEVKQVPGSSLQIGSLAKIEFESEQNVDYKKLLSESKRHEELLIECDLADFSESEGIYNYQNDLARIEVFEKENGTGQDLREEADALETDRRNNRSIWEQAESRAPIRIEDIQVDSGEVGKIEGRKESLDNENLPERIRQLEWELEEEQNRVRRLDLDARAAKLLYETLLRHRDRTRSKISSGLEEVLQKHIDGIFTSDAQISLNEDLSFDVLKRERQSLSTEWLSRGASEQLALAFRLAIADVARGDCELPIILDDDFAHSDKTRLSRIANHLKTIGSQQVILFTHQPEKFELFSGDRVELV